MARLADWKAGLRVLRVLRVRVGALYLAAADPRVPWLAKFIIVVVVAYALSPIDLIPDFIPVLGLLDDLLILPAGVWLAIRLMPATVWEECIVRAEHELPSMAPSRSAAWLIVGLWVLGVAVCGYCVLHRYWAPEV